MSSGKAKVNKINAYDIVNSPGFSNARFTRFSSLVTQLSDKLLRYYASKYSQGHKVLLRDFIVSNLHDIYTNKFLTYLIDNESKLKNEGKLDVLIVYETEYMAENNFMNYFDNFTSIGLDVKVSSKNIIESDKFKVKLCSKRKIGVDYGVDLVIMLTDYGLDYLLENPIYWHKRKDGSPLVKLIVFTDDLDTKYTEKTMLGINSFDRYDLSILNDETFKMDIRQDKLERILNGK